MVQSLLAYPRPGPLVRRERWGVYLVGSRRYRVTFLYGYARCSCGKLDCRHAAAARPLWDRDVNRKLRRAGLHRALRTPYDTGVTGALVSSVQHRANSSARITG